jgi:N-acetylmuramoyl-L-alanine amidase
MGRLLVMMRALAVLVIAVSSPATAGTPGALAQLGPGGARIEDRGGSVTITIPMTQAVPWRLHLLDAPPRLVVEFNDLVWNVPPKGNSDSISQISAGRFSADWSRFVAVLREPLDVTTAALNIASDGSATLDILLTPTTAEAFRSEVAPPEPAPKVVTASPVRFRPVVAIDPGHGGLDPGAEAEGLVEAHIMLTFARRLKENLLRSGRYDVILTREEDVFVPLEERLTRARAAGAQVFISLHADKLEDDAGPASGMTVYTLSDAASDTASERLAERHAQTDILAGMDLRGTGDDIALVLMDLARRDTSPRAEALSEVVIKSFESAGLAINSHPHRRGNFAVLRSAEIPSILVELGFLSSAKDLRRLTSEEWQDQAAGAIADALLRWHDEDRLRSHALRQ